MGVLVALTKSQSADIDRTVSAPRLVSMPLQPEATAISSSQDRQLRASDSLQAGGPGPARSGRSSS